MADKFLTDDSWKAFAKGKGIKDAAFLKALESLEKADKAGPESVVEALEEVEKQADALRKFVKGDRDFGSYLDNVDKAIGKERKTAEAKVAEAEKAAKAAKAKAAEEDEEETPELLTSKMVESLRKVREGTTMYALVATDGSKHTAVLLMKKVVPQSSRKLLADYLTGASSLKYIATECVFENGAHTFVVKGGASGLAAKLSAALLKQAKVRLKVRVRGDDPKDVDEDGETIEGTSTATDVPPEAPPAPADAYRDRLAELAPRIEMARRSGSPDVSKIDPLLKFAADKAAAGNGTGALQGLAALEKLLDAIAKRPADAAPEGADLATAFNQRLAALMPRAQAAIAAGGEHAQELKLKISEAGTLARTKAFDRANGLLDEAAALLGQPAASATGGASGTGIVNMQKARLAWVQTRKAIEAELKRLEAVILEEAGGDPEFASLDTDVRKLDQVLTFLDEELVDALDAALVASSDADRTRLRGEAREKLEAYRDYVGADEFVRELDTNPFTPLKIRETVTKSVEALRRTLV